jgi:hypothetical protein
MPATATKKQRTLSYDRYSDGDLAVTITVGDETTMYRVIRDHIDPESFDFEKFAEDRVEGSPSEYRVCIAPGEQHCQCLGFRHCRAAEKTCRHIAAATKLRERGAI